MFQDFKKQNTQKKLWISNTLIEQLCIYFNHNSVMNISNGFGHDLNSELSWEGSVHQSVLAFSPSNH